MHRGFEYDGYNKPLADCDRAEFMSVQRFVVLCHRHLLKVLDEWRAAVAEREQGPGTGPEQVLWLLANEKQEDLLRRKRGWAERPDPDDIEYVRTILKVGQWSTWAWLGISVGHHIHQLSGGW